MKSRAAVAFEAGKPLEIAEVDVGGPPPARSWWRLRPQASVTPMPLPSRVMTLRCLPAILVMRVRVSWLRWATVSKTSRWAIM
ncbi:MAG: hypothetical protein CM15mP74_29550 [Halieaceae bacterium]|nr:MAG: hypothetical protein CM15mP74_29550 [Halieaceae bacterium]